jgi:hypothetical protein
MREGLLSVILHARSVLLLVKGIEGKPFYRDLIPNAYSSEYGQQFYDNVGHRWATSEAQ